MFQDEARFGRINAVRQCWAPKPIRPLCKAMLTHEYTYAYAAVEPATGTMDALILPQVNTYCMQIFLDTVAARNPGEHIWDELREKCFHNKVFNSIDALEDDLAMGLLAMENTPSVIQ